jgi:hypothetical protein
VGYRGRGGYTNACNAKLSRIFNSKLVIVMGHDATSGRNRLPTFQDKLMVSVARDEIFKYSFLKFKDHITRFLSGTIITNVYYVI